MAINVNKYSSSEYSTKPTPQAPPPPCRDHQHNKNQTNRTITTQDRATGSASPDDISPGVFAPEDDFHKITLEQIFPDTSDDDDNDDQFTPNMFDIDPKIETTTATTTGTNTATTAEVTLEEFQQWEDEHYEAEDRTEEAINPTSNWIILAVMAMDSDIFAPIEETTTNKIKKKKKKKQKKTTLKDTHAGDYRSRRRRSPDPAQHVRH